MTCDTDTRPLPRPPNVGCRTVHLVGVALLWAPRKEEQQTQLVRDQQAPRLQEPRAVRGDLEPAERGAAREREPEQWRAELLIALAVIASVGAHAPRWIRHASPGRRGTRP
jgi:hypothetical protein